MSHLQKHSENHLVERIGWLRAAVLGANDGIVSTASLIVGVAAAAGKPGDILVAGIAGLVAGAMSMAAGEYVSVSSQSDTRFHPVASLRSTTRASPAAGLQDHHRSFATASGTLNFSHQIQNSLNWRRSVPAEMMYSCTPLNFASVAKMVPLV